MAFGNDNEAEGAASLKGSSVDIDDLGEEEGAKKVNIDEDIEKNIQIKTIPKKFKVSTNRAEEGKTKAVGAVIMVLGVLVLGAAVYLAYIFLINPKGKNPPPPPPPKAAPAAKDEKKPEPPKADSAPEKREATSSEPVSEKETGWVQSVPTSTPVAVPTSTPTASASTTPADNASSTPTGTALDTDGDGLSDIEEALLGTNSGSADSDGDSYGDKAELEGLYNPAGSGRLEANLKISKYENAKFKYGVYYPYGWRLQSMGEGESVLFSSSDNTFIQVITQTNEGNKGIVDWYNSQFAETPVTADKVIAKNGWEGVYHIDNKIFYLTDAAKANVYVLSYVPEAEDDWSYYNIYKMMISSFTVK